MLLGEKIKYLREKENLTQGMLSKKIGVSQTVLSNTERGFYTTLGPKVMKSLALALNTTVRYLSNEDMEVTSMERIKEESVKIGKVFKSLREKADMSQFELSKLLEISPAQISRLELGYVDIRGDKKEKIRNKILDVFPELEEVIDNIGKATDESKEPKPAETGIYDPEGFNNEVALDKDDAKVISEAISKKQENLTEPVNIKIDNIDDSIPSAIASKSELDYIMTLIPMDSRLNGRNLSIMDLYNKGDIEGLKKFIPNLEHDFTGDTLNKIKLPRGVRRDYDIKKARFMDDTLDKESKAEKIAKENIQLVLFDSIHNKIMYIISNNMTLPKEEREVIEAEIRLYKSITGDDSNLLELKLAKVKDSNITEV